MHYKVSDTTRISHLSKMQLLLSIKTNVANLHKQLYNYAQEQADTDVVFHAIYITKRDTFTKLVVMCSNTYVLLPFYCTILKW